MDPMDQLQTTFDKLGRQLQEIQQLKNKQVAAQQPQQAVQATETSYPINTTNPRFVEDVIANPTWNNQLTQKFLTSDIGKELDQKMLRLKEEINLEFLGFCEKETRFPSETLDNLRAQISASKKQQTEPEKVPVNQTSQPVQSQNNSGNKQNYQKNQNQQNQQTPASPTAGSTTTTGATQ